MFRLFFCLKDFILSIIHSISFNVKFLIFKIINFLLTNTANFYLASWYLTGRCIFDPSLRKRSLSDHASFPTSVSAVKRVRSAFLVYLFLLSMLVPFYPS